MTIQDDRLPKKYIRSSAPEYIDSDPNKVTILIKQDAEPKDFIDWFTANFAEKKKGLFDSLFSR
jgi:hypothetical protein